MKKSNYRDRLRGASRHENLPKRGGRVGVKRGERESKTLNQIKTKSLSSQQHKTWANNKTL